MGDLAATDSRQVLATLRRARACRLGASLAPARAGVSISGHRQGGADALPRGMGCVAPVYRPRDAEHTVLHQVIAEHLEGFLRAVAEAGDGVGLPKFVEREFREFLLCGVFEAGVARFQCEGCAREHLLPFSCCPQQETMKSPGRRTG